MRESELRECPSASCKELEVTGRRRAGGDGG